MMNSKIDIKIQESSYNPYRLQENGEEELLNFLILQKLPESWGAKQLKLAWAFQGLMSKKIMDFDLKSDYHVYAYEPYITDSNKSFSEALEDASSDLNSGRFFYNCNTSGHYVKVNTKLFAFLSKKEIDLLTKFGKLVQNKNSFSNYALIIDLDRALELVGHAKASYFRIISRIEAKTDIYSALCTVFEISDDEKNCFPREVFRSVFADNGPLHKNAGEWLDNWVEDKDLKVHFSCFMEQKRGNDRHDIYLSSHYHDRWSSQLRLEKEMPFGLSEFHSIGNVNCLLGWEWCHSDLIESKALIKIKK